MTDLFQRGTGTGLQALRIVWAGRAHPTLTLGYHVKFPSQGGGLENMRQTFLSSKSQCFVCFMFFPPENYEEIQCYTIEMSIKRNHGRKQNKKRG